MKIAVIGGGPLGIEAALYGACAGFEVQLYERGRLCENVRQWGHIGLFTEWGRNRSPLTSRLLAAAGTQLADAATAPSGNALADYLVQVAALPQLQGRMAAQTEVYALTRDKCLKGDFIDDERRADFPFRLSLRGAFGTRTRFADAVIDATGVWATPNPVGAGGTRCPGEEACSSRIDYQLPDPTGRDKTRFANRHTLVVGSGHSAASTLRSIAQLWPDYPETRLTWAIRRQVTLGGLPYALIENDSSHHRDALHRRANELAEDTRVSFRARTTVEALAFDPLRKERGGAFLVTLASWGESGPATCELHCDNVVAHTGFRPDRTLWNELQVHEHPATGGPLALAQAIITQNRRSGTGLSTGYAEKCPQAAASEAKAAPDRFLPVSGGRELMRSGEPNFFCIGIKSYGRDAGFLMHNGFAQVRDVYQLLSGDASLDLYGDEVP